MQIPIQRFYARRWLMLLLLIALVGLLVAIDAFLIPHGLTYGFDTPTLAMLCLLNATGGTGLVAMVMVLRKQMQTVTIYGDELGIGHKRWPYDHLRLTELREHTRLVKGIPVTIRECDLWIQVPGRETLRTPWYTIQSKQYSNFDELHRALSVRISVLR